MSNDKKKTAQENQKEDDKKVTLTPKQIQQLYQSERKKVVTIRREVANAENILLETVGAKMVLEEIKNGKGNEVMVPIGAGYFMPAARKMDGTLLKSMAGNVMMPTNPTDAIAECTKNEENARKQLERLQQEYQTTLSTISQLENVMNTLMQQQRMKNQANESKK